MRFAVLVREYREAEPIPPMAIDTDHPRHAALVRHAELAQYRCTRRVVRVACGINAMQPFVLQPDPKQGPADRGTDTPSPQLWTHDILDLALPMRPVAYAQFAAADGFAVDVRYIDPSGAWFTPARGNSLGREPARFRHGIGAPRLITARFRVPAPRMHRLMIVWCDEPQLQLIGQHRRRLATVSSCAPIHFRFLGAQRTI